MYSCDRICTSSRLPIKGYDIVSAIQRHKVFVVVTSKHLFFLAINS